MATYPTRTVTKYKMIKDTKIARKMNKGNITSTHNGYIQVKYEVEEEVWGYYNVAYGYQALVRSGFNNVFIGSKPVVEEDEDK